MINEVDVPLVCSKCEKLTVFYIADLRNDLFCECKNQINKGSGSDLIERQYEEIAKLFNKKFLH